LNNMILFPGFSARKTLKTFDSELCSNLL